MIEPFKLDLENPLENLPALEDVGCNNFFFLGSCFQYRNECTPSFFEVFCNLVVGALYCFLWLYIWHQNNWFVKLIMLAFCCYVGAACSYESNNHRLSYNAKRFWGNICVMWTIVHGIMVFGLVGFLYVLMWGGIFLVICFFGYMIYSGQCDRH